MDIVVFLAWVTAIAGCLCLILGIVLLTVDLMIRIKAKDATSAVAKNVGTGTNLQEHSAVADVLDSVTGLAKALKDLDAGPRVLVLSLAFFAVSAVAAGVDSITNAIVTG